MSRLTHLNAEGEAEMVDISGKAVGARAARAQAIVKVTPRTAQILAAGDAPKGDVIGVARIAGIQAAKRTCELIPLCHPLALTFVGVQGTIDVDAGEIELIAETRTTGPTGVEMEALTAVTVAALTVYDMVKGIERGARIERVQLLEKSGGRSGTYLRAQPQEGSERLNHDA